MREYTIRGDSMYSGTHFIYENDGTNTFTYIETKLEPQVQSNYSGARFGYDVLVKNGRAYVGGPQDYSSVGKASAGSVQIWDQANDGTWSRTHRLRGTETSEYFGASISVDGDYLAIGAFVLYLIFKPTKIDLAAVSCIKLVQKYFFPSCFQNEPCSAAWSIAAFSSLVYLFPCLHMLKPIIYFYLMTGCKVLKFCLLTLYGTTWGSGDPV